MSKMSDYLEAKVLDHVLGVAAYTMPGQVYLGLFTSDPADDDSGDEVAAGNGYARQAIDFNAASGDDPTFSTNDGQLLFTAAGADWGTISHFGLFDASSAGNLLIHGAFDEPKLIEDGDSFDVGDETITVTAA
ncbi:hypothetical protein A7A08_01720 [Methyloligella halotolerans]|uniref:Uncharacterized protein n=1 Tax=Methyloligella halotolerans TaxID=1177755 RepID=A0A1E2S030_9HYPH|nr:hypothetical protein [Methyloligella halotolerans]ODA67685.1 hypothetical protein A7A08_01720 [Methyloligella halotolerans]